MSDLFEKNFYRRKDVQESQKDDFRKRRNGEYDTKEEKTLRCELHMVIYPIHFRTGRCFC